MALAMVGVALVSYGSRLHDRVAHGVASRGSDLPVGGEGGIGWHPAVDALPQAAAAARVRAPPLGEVRLVEALRRVLRAHPREVGAQVVRDVVGVAEAEEVTDFVQRGRLEVVAVPARQYDLGEQDGRREHEHHLQGRLGEM